MSPLRHETISTSHPLHHVTESQPKRRKTDKKVGGIGSTRFANFYSIRRSRRLFDLQLKKKMPPLPPIEDILPPIEDILPPCLPPIEDILPPIENILPPLPPIENILPPLPPIENILPPLPPSKRGDTSMPLPTLAKTYGMMWVAVYGVKSICMVPKNEAMDITRTCPNEFACTDKNVIHRRFGTAIISQIEDLAVKFSESSQRPFAVVPVIQDASKGFVSNLIAKMGNVSLTCFDTIQVAIFVFQHLFQSKLEADEILVYFLEVHDVTRLSLTDIRRHLAAMSGDSSSGEGST